MPAAVLNQVTNHVTAMAHPHDFAICIDGDDIAIFADAALLIALANAE